MNRFMKLSLFSLLVGPAFIGPWINGGMARGPEPGREGGTTLKHGSAVEFSLDGKTLATWNNQTDKTIKLWDATTGKEKTTLSGHKFAVSCVAFSPNSKLLASGSLDGNIKLWDVETGKEQSTLSGDQGFLAAVAFSADSKTLASGAGGDVWVWDVATGKGKAAGAKLDNFPVYFGLQAFSPDIKMLATVHATDKGEIKLWEVATGKEKATLNAPGGRIYFVAFSRDGKTLATANGDMTITLLDVATGKERFTLKGHTSYVTGVAFSPDGDTLASVSARASPGEVKLWNVATGKERATLTPDSGIGWVGYSPDGKTLALGGRGTVTLLDAAPFTEPATLKGHTAGVTWVAFSPNGKRLISGSADKTIKLWDVATGKELATFKGHTAAVNTVAFSPDGKWVASASDDKTIKLWDVATGKLLTTFEGHTAHVYGVAFSPDGKKLVSGGADNTIRLWDTATFKEQLLLKGHTKPVWSVVFSADGKMVASCAGSREKNQIFPSTEVKLWDVAMGMERPVKSNAPFLNPVALGFTPDGKTLALSCDGRVTDGWGTTSYVIKLWDLATNKVWEPIVNSQSNGPYPISSMHGVTFALNPSGKTLVWAVDEQTITVTDVATRKTLFVLNARGSCVTSLVFSPDGTMLASASDDHSIKLWRMRPAPKPD